MSCLFSRSIGVLHYSADQNGEASLFVLLGLLIGGFLGLLMLKKFIPVYLTHYQVVGAMNWIEGALDQIVVARMKSLVLCRMPWYE